MYFFFNLNGVDMFVCSRPLLSRSGCIYTQINQNPIIAKKFSSPFIEERLYLPKKRKFASGLILFSSPFIEERLYLEEKMKYIVKRIVLVPFYRGAVVFEKEENYHVRT